VEEVETRSLLWLLSPFCYGLRMKRISSALADVAPRTLTGVNQISGAPEGKFSHPPELASFTDNPIMAPPGDYSLVKEPHSQVNPQRERLLAPF